ncbi:MAG: hypothetical protein HP491_08600 [Nitrospira sp.]|nr:hypothetical protein [Nitrospira sp.]
MGQQVERLTEKRIGVLMGGRSSERDVSLRTGQAVHQSLVRRGYDAVSIDVSAQLPYDLFQPLRLREAECATFLGPAGIRRVSTLKWALPSLSRVPKAPRVSHGCFP